MAGVAAIRLRKACARACGSTEKLLGVESGDRLRAIERGGKLRGRPLARSPARIDAEITVPPAAGGIIDQGVDSAEIAGKIVEAALTVCMHEIHVGGRHHDTLRHEAEMVLEEGRERQRSADHHPRCRETGIAGIDVAEMDLSLVMDAGAVHQPVGTIENGNACTTPGKHKRRAASQQSSAEHRNTPIDSAIPHIELHSELPAGIGQRADVLDPHLHHVARLQEFLPREPDARRGSGEDQVARLQRDHGSRDARSARRA